MFGHRRKPRHRKESPINPAPILAATAVVTPAVGISMALTGSSAPPATVRASAVNRFSPTDAIEYNWIDRQPAARATPTPTPALGHWLTEKPEPEPERRGPRHRAVTPKRATGGPVRHARPPKPVARRAPAKTALRAPVRHTAPPKPKAPSTKPLGVTGTWRAGVIAAAKRAYGVPYVYGGSSFSGFDCSGLVQYAYGQQGMHLPRVAHAQMMTMRATTDPQPGDLVFSVDARGYAYHVGIYTRPGFMIDAPRAGRTVGEHPIWSRSPRYRTPRL